MKAEKECLACELMNAVDADTCKHCGTAFFFELECLDPKLDDPADELVDVGQYGNIISANFVAGLLAENGIEACVPEELAPSIGQIETVTVRVARKNLETARRLLAETKSS